jgi:hypothetical protein
VELALAARIVLAAALAFAAIVKLRNQSDVRAQMAELFGSRAASAAALVVPVVELVLAVALVAWWSPVPGVVAAIVLVAFTVVVVRAQVWRVPCPCFGGSANARPAGPAAVVRNGVLIAEAVLATGDPRGAAIGATALWVVALGAVTVVVVRAS